MSEIKKFYPAEENLGQECMWWNNQIGCTFPKAEMEGRRSCEGIIDNLCLYLKDGRRSDSIPEELIFEIKTRAPDRTKNRDLPTGDIE
jgi:hypothetical protein